MPPRGDETATSDRVIDRPACAGKEGPFVCLVMAPAGVDATALVRAADKAGGLGVVADGSWPDLADLDDIAEHLGAAGVARFAVHLSDPTRLAKIVRSRPAALAAIVIAPGDRAIDRRILRRARSAGLEVYVEASGWSDALAALDDDVDGFILKGHECAGLVAEQSTFVLLQEFRRRTAAPLLARGGITPETAAAARVAGAAGVVLDDQVLLLAESPLGADARKRVAALSGTETVQIEDPAGERYLRGVERPGGPLAGEWAVRVRAGEATIDDLAGELAWQPDRIAPAGQTIGLAAPLASRYRTLGRLITAIGKAAARLPAAAAGRRALGPDGPFARANGTLYPIIQGPMTRVSDRAAFLAAVADAGALPMAALALMRGPETEALLSETRDALGDRPWGVGLLGFAQTEILREQHAVIERIKPPFAVIAGGRINQVLDFEARGIRTFVHAPTAAILSHYLDEGARRFLVEGRECGGHIGPLTSFVLWSSIVAALRDHPVIAREGNTVQIAFAGGIHDAVSAAMVATIAEPLAARGVAIGVLMGTGYLFTNEIVASEATVPDYQEVAVDCARTVALWEGPGFASRCALTPIADEFRARKRELEESGGSARDVREAMEVYSLGRLRMATKGLARLGPDRELVTVDPEQRRAEGMYMIGQVAALRDHLGSIAELHEDVSAGSVARLAEVADTEAAGPAFDAPPPADIAIVGMATLLPGAQTLAAYWRRITSGESAIRPVPEDRWSVIGNYSEDRQARDKVYSQRGGFLDDVAFDPLSYGIPPATIASIDPMQFLALELTRDALEDAGISAGDDTDRSRISVMFGFSGGLGETGSQYVARAELPRLIGAPPDAVLEKLPEWTEDSFAGLLPNVAAGRVANRFDLGGTNQTVDAACASSLAAVYGAVMELESGRADTVIAGGIDSLQTPFGYLCFSKTQALSPRGVCNTFDAAADGIVISEGLAAVVLKRLADAERDGDRIYAVIKGVGASSDGRARGLTAPLPGGQRRALSRAYAQARFDPASVQLFEAHGTGTVAGDRAELETVTGLLADAGAGPRSSAIGSVKTLIGHTKAAAGVSGLVKVALGLHHRVLPPHSAVETPNPALAAPDAPLYLTQRPRPWIAPAGLTRRAGVSAFGFGGTNYHVAVEEYRAPATGAAVELGRDLMPFVFAGDSRASVSADLADLAERVRAGAFATPRQAALAALDYVRTGPVRLGFLAASADELVARIDAARAVLDGDGSATPKEIAFSDAPALGDGGKLAFLYPGQGSQYPDMLREAALLDGAVTDALARAETVLAATPTFTRLGRPLSRFIYPGDAFSADERKRQMAELTATEVAQPALGAIEAGLTAMLAALGLVPDMVAGHSYGEFVALHAAGAIGFDDLIGLSEARGRAIVEAGDPENPGAMAAVAADADATAAAVAGLADIVIANVNGPRQTVIAGPKGAVERAGEAIAAAGLSVRSVPVSQAFHSPLMAPARARFEAALDAVSWATPARPVYSNTLAARHASDTCAISRTIADHLVSPVDFAGMVRAMVADGARVFVEAGPKSVLSDRVAEIVGDTAVRTIALDRQPGGAEAFLGALVRLFVEGCALDLRALVARFEEITPRAEAGDVRDRWYLNGAYARRAGAPKRDVTPPPALPGADRAEAAHVVPFPPSSTPKLEFIDIPPDKLNWSGPPGAESPDVLTAYHRTMQEFLRVQESVMLAYLGQQGEGLRPATGVAAAAFAPPPADRPAPPVEPIAAVPEPVMPPTAGAGDIVATVKPAGESAPASNGEVFDQPGDLVATMTAIIAEKTGYPSDALDPDQDLEADLGIDSVKKMEILGGLQKMLPRATADAMRGEMDVIAELSTIRAICDHIAARSVHPGANGKGDVEEAAGPFDQAGEATLCAATLPRFLQVAFHEPIDHLDLNLADGARFVVTEAADGFHDDVIAALGDRNAAGVVLPRDILASDDTDAIAGWVASLGDPAPAGLVYLDGRASLGDLGALDFEAWRDIHRHGVKTLFRLIQAMAPTLRDGGRVLAAMETGGHFNRSDDPAAARLSSAAGAIGLVKALSLEWPEASVKTVDLDPEEDGRARARHLVDELALAAGRREVGYPQGRRTIFRTEPAALTPPEPDSPPWPMIGPDWVVLATGGARGITAECLRTLAPHRPTLVLVGRSPLPAPEDDETRVLDAAGLRQHYLERSRANGAKVRPKDVEDQVARHLAARDMRQNLDDFARLGATVDYRSTDVCDPEAVAALIDDLYGHHGRIDLVIHGAGLIEDAFIEKKSADSIDRVFDTKVDSAFLIARALRPETLKGIALFTSVAGRYGNRGQTDYAAANETLNRLAWVLKRRFGPTVNVKAINWGPWAATTTGAGMVTPEVRQQFEARGIAMVEPGPGRDLFFKEMFWSATGEVETVAWNADGEYLEAAACALPEPAGTPRLGDRFLLLRDGTKRENGQREVIWRYDLVNAPYADHHRFDGVAVMPFAAVVQMMSELPAAFGIGAPVAALENIRLLKGLTLENGAVDVRFVLEETDAPDRLQASLLSASDPDRLHYRAELVLGDIPSGESADPSPAARPAWTGPDIHAIYRRWLSHGPRFQTLTNIETIDSLGVRAEVVPTRPEAFLTGAAGLSWNYDPGLIDGLIQTIWIWARARQGVSALPLWLPAIRRFGGDPQNGPLTLENRIFTLDDPTQITSTIRAFDAAGHLVYELDHFHALVSARLNRLGGGWQGGEREPADKVAADRA